LLTRRFGQITEMKGIFNQALEKIKDPDKLSPTALKAQINKNMWDIIKNGSGESAVKVRAALQKLGFENVPGQGYVMRGQPAAAATTQSVAKTAADEGRTAASNEAMTAAASEAKAVARNEAKAVASSEARAGVAAARGEAGLLARVGGAEGALVKGLWVVNIYFAWDAYKDGTRANTPAPVGSGMIGGSAGEGVLNAVGSLAGGGPELGTTLRQAAELGTAVHKPEQLWDAVKSGANPTSIGMGIIFGAFR
jgi:hypothetical protein